MTEINEETIRATVQEADPTVAALSGLLREVAAEAVHNLYHVLMMLGQNPQAMPSEFLIQAMLVEAEKVFQPVSKDNWDKIYDSYQAVKAVLAAHPEIQEQYRAAVAANAAAYGTNAGDPAESVDPLLDGDF